jgi:hypothetical protein
MCQMSFHKKAWSEMQGITFKERDRALHLTASLKNNKGF